MILHDAAWWHRHWLQEIALWSTLAVLVPYAVHEVWQAWKGWRE